MYPYNEILVSIDIYTHTHTHTYCNMDMNPENIMLSERSKSRKSPHFMISFIWKAQTRQSHGDRKEFSGCLGLRGVGGDRA